MDLITLLQEELSVLNTHFSNCTGALQASAQPASTSGEPLEGRDSAQTDGQGPVNTEADARNFADLILQSSKQLDSLIKQLPDLPSEQQQLSQIAKLQQQNEEAADALRKATAETQDTLAEVQAVFGVLADQQIKQQQTL